jgi:glycosyltransferase involved in cell wall biosynthesis
MWDRSAPSVAVWHEFDLNKFSGNKLIAYPIFETTKFNKEAVNYLQQMDCVVVTSKWAKNVVEENIGASTPITVVQGGSDLLQTPAVLSTPRNATAFTFLALGKLEQRKSYAETIAAYIQAFENKDADTRLVCHCFTPFDKNFQTTVQTLLSQLGLEIINYSTVQGSITARRGSAFVEIPRGQLPKEHVYRLYRHAHVGIFPAKAEGWNLPLLECIKSGTPAITLNYSAPTEYANEAFGYPKELLLNDFNLVTANDGVFFHGDRGKWAQPNIDEISAAMLYCYDNYSNLEEKFQTTSSKITEQFTWQNTAKQLLEVVDSVS